MNQQETMAIMTGKLARELLRNGYTIVDLKPQFENPDMTVFFFRIENNIKSFVREYNNR